MLYTMMGKGVHQLLSHAQDLGSPANYAVIE